MIINTEVSCSRLSSDRRQSWRQTVVGNWPSKKGTYVIMMHNPTVVLLLHLFMYLYWSSRKKAWKIKIIKHMFDVNIAADISSNHPISLVFVVSSFVYIQFSVSSKTERFKNNAMALSLQDIFHYQTWWQGKHIEAFVATLSTLCPFLHWDMKQFNMYRSGTHICPFWIL